jgi:hypothetical protein
VDVAELFLWINFWTSHIVGYIDLYAVIALILVLPISIAGFGARENLFLYFFSQSDYRRKNIVNVYPKWDNDYIKFAPRRVNNFILSL